MTNLNHRTICRLWAEGNPAYHKGFAILHAGSTIYSYGTHFPIAAHHTDHEGKHCILFTSERYSVTTAKHKTYVMDAIARAYPGRVEDTVYHVPHVLPRDQSDHYVNCRAMLLEARQSADKAERARTDKWRDFHNRDAMRWRQMAERYAAAFHCQSALADAAT